MKVEAENIDIEAPIVSNIEVISPITGGHTTGTEIHMQVNWSEEINVVTAPILKIKFSNSEEKTATVMSINSDTIEYVYTVEEGDLGTLELVSYTDGEVKQTQWFDKDTIPQNLSDNPKDAIRDYYKKYFNVDLHI